MSTTDTTQAMPEAAAGPSHVEKGFSLPEPKFDDQGRSIEPKYIHHVNFPTTNVDRTVEWYTKVFGLKRVMPKSNTRVVLMTKGRFDLHFTPVEEMDRMAPYHFAMEVEDWDGFLGHLDSLGIRHTRPVERPENNSKFCYIHDPDHTMIELVFHGKRPA
ncbi:VOC family protein [Microbacterium sp. PRC9]|uniref:VOC family protein n=1 Tax=Microbacterium sp. PRC9 TaxID=2962591 RepID=UPI00288214F7|nr:VOC family protein [Microbacterium sp. PRC9]MDT0143187.1 VOC family protein [Microbacterium sp. PRC9]